MLVPNFNLQIADLAILFSAMISFLALIWASRKLLFLMQISDFSVGLSIKKDELRARAIKKRGKIKNSFFKINQTRQEKTRRKKLYKIKKSRYESQVNKQKIRAKNGRVINVQKRLDKSVKPISHRIPKSVNNYSSSGKRTNRKQFMTTKYDYYVQVGAFKNSLK